MHQFGLAFAVGKSIAVQSRAEGTAAPACMHVVREVREVVRDRRMESMGLEEDEAD